MLYLGRGPEFPLALEGALARRAQAFHMRVLYHNRQRAPHLEVALSATYRALEDLLRESDFVVMTAPLTSETRAWIGERELRAMKPTAFLINIARGGIVVEDALVRALQERWIAGAGVDVFEREPLPPTSPLWQLDNVIISPHVAAATPNYDDRAVELFCENLRRYLHGEPLLNVVDPRKGY